MWYHSGDWDDTIRIGHATSPDGINWTKGFKQPGYGCGAGRSLG